MADVTARDVIVQAMGLSWKDETPVADRILTALTEAGISVGRYEVVGLCDKDGTIHIGASAKQQARLKLQPVFRRVEGGATGEETE